VHIILPVCQSKVGHRSKKVAIDKNAASKHSSHRNPVSHVPSMAAKWGLALRSEQTRKSFEWGDLPFPSPRFFSVVVVVVVVVVVGGGEEDASFGPSRIEPRGDDDDDDDDDDDTDTDADADVTMRCVHDERDPNGDDDDVNERDAVVVAVVVVAAGPPPAAERGNRRDRALDGDDVGGGGRGRQ